MLNYASITKAVNGFKAFAGAPSLRMIGAQAMRAARGAGGYATSRYLGRAETAMRGRSQAMSGLKGLGSALGGYFSGAGASSPMRRFALGAGRTAAAAGLGYGAYSQRDNLMTGAKYGAMAGAGYAAYKNRSAIGGAMRGAFNLLK